MSGDYFESACPCAEFADSAAGATASGDGSLYQPRGGTFHLQIAATPAAS